MPVLEIGGRAFRGGNSDNPNNRDAITSIVVPNSVEIIGGFAFYAIDELTSVTLPDELKAIPLEAFFNCKKLSKVNLPTSLEEIYSNAYAGCNELTDLVIPASLNDVKFTSEQARWQAINGGLTILRALGIDVLGKKVVDGSSDEIVIAIAPNNGAFGGCGKLPLAIRSKLQGWGYTDSF